jgi:hypothetical protein
MPTERQRRTLDPPSQQPLIQIAMKTPQSVEVYSVLIDRDELHDWLFTSGTQRQKHGLISESKPIVRPRHYTLSHRLALHI